MAQYEKGLDGAIDFVEKNTLNQLSQHDVELFNHFINEYIDYFKSSPEQADQRLENGDLTYVNLIAPGLLDAFEEETDILRLNTFKYRLSVNNTYAISSVLERQEPDRARFSVLMSMLKTRHPLQFCGEYLVCLCGFYI